MKTLKLETVAQAMINSENKLFGKAIYDFIISLTLELMKGAEFEALDVCDYTPSESKQNREMQINLSEDTGLVYSYESYATFDAEGWVEDVIFEVTKIQIYLHDGSEFDATDVVEIQDFIKEEIKA